MALKVDHFFGCTTTKTGSLIIGCINMALSVISMIILMLYAALLVYMSTDADVERHTALFVTFLIITSIGILAAIFQILFCIMLIKGVNKREPTWIGMYMIYGTVALFFGVLSLLMLSFNIVSLSWAIIMIVLQIYFLVVIYSEYKIILKEKTSECPDEPQSEVEKSVE